MKPTLYSLSALLSGVFLNLGLVRLAERLDPLASSGEPIFEFERSAAAPCIFCEVPAEFHLVG